MKIIIYAFVLVSNFSIGQMINGTDVDPKIQVIESGEFYPFSHISKNLDTLYLANTDLGMMTLDIWKSDPDYNGSNPVIMVVRTEWIDKVLNQNKDE